MRIYPFVHFLKYQKKRHYQNDITILLYFIYLLYLDWLTKISTHYFLSRSTNTNTTIYHNLVSTLESFVSLRQTQKPCFDEIQSVSNSPVQIGTSTNKEHIRFPEFQSILKKKKKVLTSPQKRIKTKFKCKNNKTSLKEKNSCGCIFVGQVG